MLTESKPTPGAPLAPLRRSRLRHYTQRLITLVLAAYLLLLAAVYLGQNWMIFPGAATQGKRSDQVSGLAAAADQANIVQLKTAAGDSIVAFFGQATGVDGQPLADAARRPTVLLFYGNGMSLRDAIGWADCFRAAGANVIAPDYVGFGMSSGHASEKNCYATADACYDYLLTRPDVDKSKLIAAGVSLGGAIAIDLASRREVAGLMTFDTFTSMAEMGHKTLPVLPTFLTRLLLAHPFASESKMKHVRCPTFIAHGLVDELVPFEMADRLAKAAAGPVTRLNIPDTGHWDIFDIHPNLIWEAVAKFVAQINSH